ncbi:MAG: hypothetical protein QM530_06295 [Phycisphaerales bacterium]|nr:hypothetical protein [Phycisphaerales bacterium]
MRIFAQLRLYVFLFGLVFGIALNSCAQPKINKEFMKDILSKNKLLINSIDTVKGKMTIFLPLTKNDAINRIFEMDKVKSLNDPDKLDAIISYKVMTLTSNFISAVKTVYIEDASSPRGFFAWDEKFNYYLFEGSVYNVKYNLVEDIRPFLNDAIEQNILDADCANVELKTSNDLNYYFYETKLYLHNPITTSFCDVDIPIKYSSDAVTFSLIDWW